MSSDRPNRDTRAYYAASAATFLGSDEEEIVGRLATRVASEHRGNEIQQMQSWRREITLLRSAFTELHNLSSRWGFLLELPLLRLGRRIDAVILIRNVIVVVEFKIGARTYNSADREQVEDYALCLRDFHAASAGKLIVPILCADQAETRLSPVRVDTQIEHVTTTVLTNGQFLAQAFRAVADASEGDGRQLDWQEFDQSGYNPTPTIVEAARAIYAGHTVLEIGRTDAAGQSLTRAGERLQQIADSAHRHETRNICFVTGIPGSGKTLLGLELVFAGTFGRVAGEPAALLSGNPPLVHVLREALAADAAERVGSKKEARRQAQAALQTLLGYLKEHRGSDSSPPEHVIVYDEAQRAWDEETGRKLLGRSRSEPALFLEILSRLPWTCLVCLVGQGQEINRGEGGLTLWGTALAESARNNVQWRVHAAPEMLRTLRVQPSASLELFHEPDLHLSNGLRTYRNPSQDHWVSALLDGNVDLAHDLASAMTEPPAYIMRDLEALRSWLQARQRGSRRVGLLASSGAVRLLAEGMPASPRSNELDRVAHWFLRPYGDFRSSNALEVPLSEFVCQGLEIDYAGLCWGGDLLWRHDRWLVRDMRAPAWQTVRSDRIKAYRINAYRVLLTRARAGLAIFVPNGNDADATRDPHDFLSTYEMLHASGCVLADCGTS